MVVMAKNMTWYHRIKLEMLYNAGIGVTSISKQLGYSRNTIYRELKRGMCVQRNTDWTERVIYSSDLGQQQHDFLKHNKGKGEKIGGNIELIEFIETMIIENKLSPEAALAEAEKAGLIVNICLRTLYRYIDNGLFLRLTNADLPEKKDRKRDYRRVRVAKRLSKGKGIEERPSYIEERVDFGHWEMDTVKGKRGKSKSCLLVLTERKTREEIIFKMPDQKAESVVNLIDSLEVKYGGFFSKVFKSITVDNGVEFSDYISLERSLLSPGNKRTELYFCHPYSSWERGSNERANKLIRRQIPKGTDIDKISNEEIKRIEEWVNKYPRRMFSYRCSGELFKDELSMIFNAA